MGKRAIVLDEHLVIVRHTGRDRLGWVGVLTDRSGSRPVNRAMLYEDWPMGQSPWGSGMPVCEVQDDEVVRDLGPFGSFWNDPENVAWLVRLADVRETTNALRLVRAVCVARRVFRPENRPSPDTLILVDRAHQTFGMDPARWPQAALSVLMTLANEEAERTQQDLDHRRAWAQHLSASAPGA